MLSRFGKFIFGVWAVSLIFNVVLSLATVTSLYEYFLAALETVNVKWFLAWLVDSREVWQIMLPVLFCLPEIFFLVAVLNLRKDEYDTAGFISAAYIGVLLLSAEYTTVWFGFTLTGETSVFTWTVILISLIARSYCFISCFVR